ncbi:MAG TPA: hypothetical protein VL126_02370 [Bacteroidota bacterium]|nr:hypothetical protein [Bacteroidota bacterium]
MHTTLLSLSRSRLSVAWMLVLVGLANSCNERATPPVSPGPQIINFSQAPASYEQGTIPVQIGNQWVYVDSEAGHSSLARIQEVIGIAFEDGVFRFQLSHASAQTTWIFWGFQYNYIRNDTVFFVNPNSWTSNRIGIEYLPSIGNKVAVKYPASPLGSLDSTIVYPLGHSLATPAGVFDSVYVYDTMFGVYSSSTPLGPRVLQYFRPGVGLLDAKVVDPIDSSLVLVESRLIYFYANHFY